jgi:hypothetical protein
MCVAIKADGVPLRQMWVPRKALGHREANGVPKGMCVAIKADGVPLRQTWAPRKALGRREANGAHKIKEDLMVHKIKETCLKET